MDDMKFVVATSGGGGHLFPALKVADELKARGHEVFFIGGFAQGVEEIKRLGYPHELLRVHGFTGNLKNRILFFFCLGQSLFKSMSLLKQIKPDRVIGFGGYGAVSVVVAAWMLKYPTLIHEQNVVPGKANKVLSRFVRKIAISFPESKSFFPRNKIVISGCPCNVRQKKFDRNEILKKFNLDANRKTLLVLGGSQGSRKINAEILKMMQELKDQPLQLIHICGKKDYDALKAEYAQQKIAVALFAFFSPIEEAYAIADVIVSRAGAVTVTEIAMSQKRAILIPYPFAGGHQKENASALVKTGLAQMIEEKDLDSQKLKSAIIDALTISEIDQSIKSRLAAEFTTDAAWRLAQQAIHLN